MDYKDKLQTKLHLGYCADSLISLFIYIAINKIVAIVYFIISTTLWTVSYLYKIEQIDKNERYYKKLREDMLKKKKEM